MSTQHKSTLLERLLSIPVILCVAFAVVVFFFVPRGMADPDIWWHLRNAQFLMTQHRFLTEDLYSFTAHGAAWINHEWLSELPFYLGWTLGGAAGVSWVTVLVVELDLLGIFWLSWRTTRNPYAATAAGVVAVVLSTVSFGPRTLLFGWLCLIVELLVLQQSHRSPRALWALPALFALWVNLHGSWMIGMVVLLAYIACGLLPVHCGLLSSERHSPAALRRLLLVFAASVLAVFANPYGWRLVAYPFNLAFHQKLNISNVEEWHSMDPHSPRGMLLLISLAAVVVLQLCRGRRWKLYELAFVGIGLYSGLCYTRFLFLFAILALPVLAVSVASAPPRTSTPPRPLLNAALLLLLLALVVGRLRHPEPDTSLTKMYPVHALPALAQVHPQGRVFNEYLWGGYMTWNLRDWPVFVDSRVDIFEYNGTFKDYLDIIRIQDTLRLLDKYGIRYVLFEKDTPLVYLLQRSGGWKVDYDQDNVILLERTAAQGTQESQR